MQPASVPNSIFEALLKQLGENRGNKLRESLPPFTPFSSLLLDLRASVPPSPPPPPGSLRSIGVRLSGRPRLTTLSGGIYIRPNHIKQRLGGFIAHGERKRDKMGGGGRSGRTSRMSRIYTVAVKRSKRNVFVTRRRRRRGWRWRWRGRGSRILFEGHVTPSGWRGCRACQRVGVRARTGPAADPRSGLSSLPLMHGGAAAAVAGRLCLRVCLQRANTHVHAACTPRARSNGRNVEGISAAFLGGAAGFSGRSERLISCSESG